MDTQMILTKLSLIFQEILKKDNIVLTNETTAQDVEGWNSLTNMILISRIEKILMFILLSEILYGLRM